MPRTPDQLARAAADAEAWLDSLDPASTAAEDTTDLRAIAAAVADVEDHAAKRMNAMPDDLADCEFRRGGKHGREPVKT